MKLHQLPKTHTRSQRIGRGGKRGTTAGRGTKGQRSRAGHRMRPAERDLILRLPKQRGFRNKPKSDRPAVFNLDDLAAALKSFAKGSAPVELTKEFLVVAGLLGKNFTGTVKILGDGAIAVPVAVKGIAVSAGAKAKIEKAGGSVL
ncbi:MAG TPA: uL15 family ribosomal protein [Candidatus Paceibacterota bacterium]|nr:uL15 family ribosomal protein [Candidatus Paceibacterota bacterium]